MYLSVSGEYVSEEPLVPDAINGTRACKNHMGTILKYSASALTITLLSLILLQVLSCFVKKK